ncbi:MAG TPA: LysE family translocator [Actinomycetota bacterium]|jgi:threonine/homoserine/homoserine lactone efflux protein
MAPGRRAVTPLGAFRWGSAGPFLLTALAIMGSPGPATISLTATGSAHGVRRSLGYLAGIVAGTTVVLAAVATGITAALIAVPAIRIVLVAVSVAYLLWLAYHVATAPPLQERGAGARAPSIAGGLLLGVANPKAWVAIGAVFASAHLADSPVADAGAKVVVLTVMIVVINAAWLALGATFAPLLRDPRRARVVNVTLAAVLVVATGFAVVH